MAAAGTEVTKSLGTVQELAKELTPENVEAMDQEAQKLAAGSTQISAGNDQLQDGYKTLTDTKAGEKLTAGAAQISGYSDQIKAGITTLQGENNANADNLLNGAATLTAAKSGLDKGVKDISKATGRLVTGISTLAGKQQHIEWRSIPAYSKQQLSEQRSISAGSRNQESCKRSRHSGSSKKSGKILYRTVEEWCSWFKKRSISAEKWCKQRK